MYNKKNNIEELHQKQIQRIDSGIIHLMDLSEMARFKKIEISTSFGEEFFKKIKNYINLE